MSKEAPLYIETNHLLQVGITDEKTKEVIPDGECLLTLLNSTTNTEVGGFVWPATMTYEDEKYKFILPSNLSISAGDKLKAKIVFSRSGIKSTWFLNLVAKTQDTRINTGASF